MKKIIGIIALALISITVILFISYKFLTDDLEFGGDPVAENAALLKRATNFQDGHFHNTLKERGFGIWVNIKDRMNAENRFPPAPFPIIKPQYEHIVEPGLSAVWFGHASVLVEIDGYRVFFDPVFSDYAFPIKALAPQRQNPPPLLMTELPRIDAIVISHDHFDHLDMKTIQYFGQQGSIFFVGYGVGTHLKKWGIPSGQIKEMKWGDSIQHKGLTFNCTEARHYSGRKSMSSNTLWTSWVVQGPKHTIFHSGDSGYSQHFKEIGQRFNNIDMSLIKIGDYGLDLGWQDIHMIPENSIQAHLDIGAKLMLPIHWGVFVLSNHPWNEPIERAIAAAQKRKIKLITPKLGEKVIFGNTINNDFWWRNLIER